MRMRIDILPRRTVCDRVDQGGLPGSYGGLVCRPLRECLVNEATLAFLYYFDCIPNKHVPNRIQKYNETNFEWQAQR
jgi:hypothetical protein